MQSVESGSTTSTTTSGSTRPRKEKRLSYVLNDADDTKHCAGVNCLALLQSSAPDCCDYLFTGSRDGTVKRWALTDNRPTFSATFDSHLDWVNDAVLAGSTLVSCSSDTTIKTWNSLSDGACTSTLRQHSDYVNCLAVAAKNSNIIASGGLGGEVFIWDIDAAVIPVTKSVELMGDDYSGNNRQPLASSHCNDTSDNVSVHNTGRHCYSPVAVEGHKESIYALAMNESGTLLVSGGTEKVIRVWDPRTGSKNMELQGHTDNIRALLLDSTGRYCLSGSSDSMIRLWDLGQQRCVHSFAVHTDSVWALASTPNFTHVYSGGRDRSLCLTDLSTRESLVLCTKEHSILQLALQDETIWVATTDSSVQGWPAEGHYLQKVSGQGGSFVAGTLPSTRAWASLEGTASAPVHKESSFTIPGSPVILQHEILNNRRHVLTKDSAGQVKLWEVTSGAVIEDYGKVSFDKKKEELFEMVSFPAWFTMDTRLGRLLVHLDFPQCFYAETYAADLNISEESEDMRINLGQETLRGLLAHWLTNKRLRYELQDSTKDDGSIGKDVTNRDVSRVEFDDGDNIDDTTALPRFDFSTVSPPSIVTEGSRGVPWRKKITDLDGTEDEKDLPWWCMDCVLNGRLPPRDSIKLGFYLRPCEGSDLPSISEAKSYANRILQINKVINYVIQKIILDKPLESVSYNRRFCLGLSSGLSPLSCNGYGSRRSGSKPWQHLKPFMLEILCNNQVLPLELSLDTVRAFVWKKQDDMVLKYRRKQSIVMDI